MTEENHALLGLNNDRPDTEIRQYTPRERTEMIHDIENMMLDIAYATVTHIREGVQSMSPREKIVLLNIIMSHIETLMDSEAWKKERTITQYTMIAPIWSLSTVYPTWTITARATDEKLLDYFNEALSCGHADVLYRLITQHGGNPPTAGLIESSDRLIELEEELGLRKIARQSNYFTNMMRQYLDSETLQHFATHHLNPDFFTEEDMDFWNKITSGQTDVD